MEINEEILLIKNVILNIVKDCKKIYLFASFAYGEPHKNSDYGFWIVLQDSKKHPIYTIQKIHKKLGKTKGTNTSYDILANCKSNFEERKNLPTLERKIAKKGILLFKRKTQKIYDFYLKKQNWDIKYDRKK